MRNAIIVSVILGLVALIGCTKSKSASGGKCIGKSDCADGRDCYIIGINFICFTKEEGEAACKAACTGGKKCHATQNATQADKPEYMMGGCVD